MKSFELIPPSRTLRSALRCAAYSLGLLLAGAGLSGCGKGGRTIPGIDRFHVGVMEERLLISFVSQQLTLDQGLSFPVPGLPDAQLAFAPDLASSGTVIQFSAALQGEGGPSVLPPASLGGLPDGRPLPDVRSGTLPRRDLNIGPVTLSLYLSEESWGLFLPLKLKNKSGLGLLWTIKVPIVDEHGYTLGRAYAIPPRWTDPHSSAGILLLVPFTQARP